MKVQCGLFIYAKKFKSCSQFDLSLVIHSEYTRQKKKTGGVRKMMGHMYTGWGYRIFEGGGWWTMGIGMIFNVLLLVAAVYLFSRFFMKGTSVGCCGSHTGNHTQGNAESAEDILRRRLAAGEITPEEYRRIQDELK